MINLKNISHIELKMIYLIGTHHFDLNGKEKLNRALSDISPNFIVSEAMDFDIDKLDKPTDAVDKLIQREGEEKFWGYYLELSAEKFGYERKCIKKYCEENDILCESGNDKGMVEDILNSDRIVDSMKSLLLSFLTDDIRKKLQEDNDEYKSLLRENIKNTIINQLSLTLVLEKFPPLLEKIREFSPEERDLNFRDIIIKNMEKYENIAFIGGLFHVIVLKKYFENMNIEFMEYDLLSEYRDQAEINSLSLNPDV